MVPYTAGRAGPQTERQVTSVGKGVNKLKPAHSASGNCTRSSCSGKVSWFRKVKQGVAVWLGNSGPRYRPKSEASLSIHIKAHGTEGSPQHSAQQPNGRTAPASVEDERMRMCGNGNRETPGQGLPDQTQKA